jgi:hypothetical protein
LRFPCHRYEQVATTNRHEHGVPPPPAFDRRIADGRHSFFSTRSPVRCFGIDDEVKPLRHSHRCYRSGTGQPVGVITNQGSRSCATRFHFSRP